MKRLLYIVGCVFIVGLCVYGGKFKIYEVLSYECVGCEDCVKVCPKNCITVKRGKAVIDISICIGCSQCADICSFDAIREGKKK